MTVLTQFKAGFQSARAEAILSDLQQAVHDQGELDRFSFAEETVEALLCRVPSEWLRWSR